MWLIVGLGNPGEEYRETRHNLGFRAVDLLSKRWKISTTRQIDNYISGVATRSGKKIFLLKPLSYMNRSGEVVGPIARRESIPGNRILILIDDMDLALGTIRYRPHGGTAGHLGMESIVEALNHKDFHRVRMGIGRSDEGEEGAEYVLSGFPETEVPIVDEMLHTAATLVEGVVFEGNTDPVTIQIKEIKEEL